MMRVCLHSLRSLSALRTSAMSTSSSSSSSSSSPPDFYAVLGVTRAASKAEIRRAYLDKAKEYHPSLPSSTSSSTNMFRMLADAYFVLSDAERRRAFDESQSFGTSHGGTSSQSRGPWRPRQYESAERVFDKIFGEATKPEMEDKDYHEGHGEGVAPTDEYLVTIDLEQALRGCDTTIKLMLKVTCPRCGGSLSEPGYTWNVCPYCEGTGIETERVGHVLTRRDCSYCHGTKRFYKYPCLQCEGKGKVIMSANYTFAIPPGTQNGQVIRVPVIADFMKYTEHTEEMSIFVYVTVRDSHKFRRDPHHALDIISEEDLSPSQALLGGQLFVQGLHDETVELDVFSSTSSHSHRYINQGGVRLPTAAGDHCVSLGIRAPTILSERAKELWRIFAKDDVDVEGTVDGVEAENDHKYKLNVVEASKVHRPFNIKPINEDEENEDKLLVLGDFRRVWRKLSAMG